MQNRGLELRFALSAERDRYVKHHRTFGGTGWVWLKSPTDASSAMRLIGSLKGVEAVLTRDEARGGSTTCRTVSVSWSFWETKTRCLASLKPSRKIYPRASGLTAHFTNPKFRSSFLTSPANCHRSTRSVITLTSRRAFSVDRNEQPRHGTRGEGRAVDRFHAEELFQIVDSQLDTICLLIAGACATESDRSFSRSSNVADVSAIGSPLKHVLDCPKFASYSIVQQLRSRYLRTPSSGGCTVLGGFRRAFFATFKSLRRPSAQHPVAPRARKPNLAFRSGFGQGPGGLCSPCDCRRSQPGAEAAKTQQERDVCDRPVPHVLPPCSGTCRAELRPLQLANGVSKSTLTNDFKIVVSKISNRVSAASYVNSLFATTGGRARHR